MGPEHFFDVANKGNPWKLLGHRSLKRLTPPCTPTCTGGGGGREAIGVPAETATGQYNVQNLGKRGELLAEFCLPSTRGVNTCLIYPHPTTHLDLLLHHLIPQKASRQRVGSHHGKGGSKYSHPRPWVLLH